ncbi:hypothetical protein K7G98_03635 [Saccharothrix sp. MB29]|nr:hypothetical protein [Saccharothrix sp. MB29]
MSTVVKVLEWAAMPGGPVPVGPLRNPGRLRSPGPPVVAALERLARTAAARLGAGTPPLGDPGPVGPGALLLAAGIGGLHDRDLSAAVLAVVPPPLSWADRLTRHGLAEPALRALADKKPREDWVQAVLRASPLTALAFSPVDALENQARATAAQLVERPGGRRLLATVLGRWAANPWVMRRRRVVLEVLGTQHPGAVLEVYTAARLHHGAEWDERIDWAARELRGRGLASDIAVETIRFWAPLARLVRSDRAAVRARVFLDAEEYSVVVALVEKHRMTGGPA